MFHTVNNNIPVVIQCFSWVKVNIVSGGFPIFADLLFYPQCLSQCWPHYWPLICCPTPTFPPPCRCLTCVSTATWWWRIWTSLSASATALPTTRLSPSPSAAGSWACRGRCPPSTESWQWSLSRCRPLTQSDYCILFLRRRFSISIFIISVWFVWLGCKEKVVPEIKVEVLRLVTDAATDSCENKPDLHL